MSRMASEKSPRLLLQCVQELYDNLHESTTVDEAVIESGSGRSNAGFILSHAESLLVDIRTQLDVPYSGDRKTPLMLRIRDHVNQISELLTGTAASDTDVSSTTLHDLIRNVQALNRSVCTVNEPTCVLQ